MEEKNEKLQEIQKEIVNKERIISEKDHTLTARNQELEKKMSEKDEKLQEEVRNAEKIILELRTRNEEKDGEIARMDENLNEKKKQMNENAEEMFALKKDLMRVRIIDNIKITLDNVS